MPIFSESDSVYREDSGANAATVMEIATAGGEVVYRLSYAEGGEGYWPESALFATIEERDAALGGACANQGGGD
jgi:hypothetical protein